MAARVCGAPSSVKLGSITGGATVIALFPLAAHGGPLGT
jgi:hypothetical protein